MIRDCQTAATLTFIIYMLAEHPEVMKRLREEIMQMVGSSRRPTYDDLRDMKYMRAVINGVPVVFWFWFLGTVLT